MCELFFSLKFPTSETNDVLRWKLWKQFEQTSPIYVAYWFYQCNRFIKMWKLSRISIIVYYRGKLLLHAPRACYLKVPKIFGMNYQVNWFCISLILCYRQPDRLLVLNKFSTLNTEWVCLRCRIKQWTKVVGGGL